MKRLRFLPYLAILSAGLFAQISGVSAQENEYVTITDGRGKEVRVKKNPQKIATFPIPHPHIIAAMDGGVDRIIGVHPMTVSAAKVSVFSRIAPGILTAKTGYLKGLALNLEELIKVNPDVFFTDSVLEGMDNLERSGIPVVYLGLIKETVSYRGTSAEVFSPKATMKNWVDITSKVLDKEKGNTSQVADVWEDTEKEIAKKLASVPESKKPRVLIMFQTKNLTVAGSGTFGHYWIARTGGINAAESAKGSHPAMVKVGSFEEILKWNPDIVYLTNFEDTMPEDLYQNKISGQDWSQIAAVRNKRVYRIPLGIYRWYPPSLDGPLMLKWMAQKNHPDLVKYDMEKELIVYFKKYHHYALTKAEAASILNPVPSGNL